MGDADGNGIPDWIDQFNAAASNGALVWWGGGSSDNGNPFVIDGVAVTFPAQWCPPLDTDGDGIPDWLDVHPSDPNNHSCWWPGGAIQFQGRNYFVRAQWFAGSNFSDNNSNGAPDCMEAALADLSSPQMYHWLGGTILIEGQYSTFGEWYLYGCGSGDVDGDGLPDAIDPYPNDSWNGTQYWWSGGDWVINGVPTHFNGGSFAGLASPDSDGDGIPDNFDPYPGDSVNNTAWWQGGTFLMNGSWQTFAGCWHAANADDADGDGIPDDLDPNPNDPLNNSAWWPGGDRMIDGSLVSLPAQWHIATDVDADHDGIPDSIDPHPSDILNGTTGFVWPPFDSAGAGK